MKKNCIRLTALLLVVWSCLVMPIHAVTYASDYIDGYLINVYTSGNTICTDFEVYGTGRMTKIGASSIKIYQYPYGLQNIVNIKTESAKGMSTENDYVYGNTVKYTGEPDTDYMVVVTIFAKNSTGSDSRTETYYVST